MSTAQEHARPQRVLWASTSIAAAADAGIDADALAEHLQRHGAGAFTADWAAPHRDQRKSGEAHATGPGHNR